MQSDVRRRKNKSSISLPLWAGVILVVDLIVAVGIPNFIRSGPDEINGIINRLRQIDAAKQQWALDHGITNAMQLKHELTPEDLTPYLLPDYSRKEFGNPICGERYIINDLDKSPEAELTQNFREMSWPYNWRLPKGTIIRLKVKGIGEEYILPGQESKPCNSLSEAISRS